MRNMNGQAYPGASLENYTTVLGDGAEGLWNIMNKYACIKQAI